MSFLTEWRPFGAQTRSPLWDEMIRDFFGQNAETPTAALARFAARANVHETAEAYVVQVELPGVAPEDVKVTLVGDTLTIQGEKKQEEKREGDHWHVLERGWGSFQRAFTFPSPVQTDGVEAESTNGVLTVRVAKAKEAQPRRIEIKAKK